MTVRNNITLELLVCHHLSHIHVYVFTNAFLFVLSLGLPQGVPPVSGVPSMMPQGGGPPGAPPSYGDIPPQQPPQVYDGSPPPSPNHIMPHAIHSLPKQVKHVKQALNTLNML